MCSTVIAANNTIIYMKVSERIKHKCSHHKTEIVIKWAGTGVS